MISTVNENLGWRRALPSRGGPRYRVLRAESDSDSRCLATDAFGDDHGVPVIFMHGMPGSRSGPYPRGVVLYRQGVRLIAYDRPGYGDSTRHEGRAVAAAAADVRAIADHLGIERFAVAGRSGGGPHALAVAAGLPDRVTAVAVLVGFAPLTPATTSDEGTMCDGNVRTFALTTDKPRLREDLQKTARHTSDDPERFIDERIRDGLSLPDHRVIDNVVIRRQLRNSYAEALGGGDISGWEDDLCALNRDWGFPLAEVRAPTLLWHGADDRFSPAENAYRMAKQLPRSEVEVERDAGHFGAVEVLPRVLSWLADRHGEAMGGGSHR